MFSAIPQNRKLYVVIVLFVINCTTVYNIHITAIPEGDYDIYYDNKQYGVMPVDGDTTIQFPKISVLKTPILELRGADRYGCFQLGPLDSTRETQNVKSYNISGVSMKNCEIVFDLSKTNVDNRFDQKKVMTTEEIKNISNSPIHFCVADLRLLQKGIKAYDYDNTEYKIMKKYVDYNLQKNGFAWDLAVSQKVKYLVVFYGYSVLESRGIAPGTAVASVALTTLGILVGVNTGFYTIVYPTGQDRKSVMDSYCAIFSIDSNRCLYNAKSSIESFNSSNIETQIMGLYDQLFEEINPFFIKDSETVRENRRPTDLRGAME